MTDLFRSSFAWVILIDGRSGSGKTRHAEGLATARGAQVLHLDDLYPGWEGLAEGSAAVATALRDSGYHRYDWHAGNFAEWIALDPTTPLIIEGCGAITSANLAAARAWAGERRVYSVWLDAPEPLRKQRALARDGDLFAFHWDAWAHAEHAHYTAHLPWNLADEVAVEAARGQ